MYVLTRLGFGLNVAPKVMTMIVEAVLAKDEQVARAASSYIDDVLVDEDIKAVEKVIDVLHAGGIEAKEPEHLGAKDGACVLGLHVDSLHWKRDRVLPEIGQ